MSRKMNCPTCGARTSVARFERDGCWSCAKAKQDTDQEWRFQEFMEKDEIERWRFLWEQTQ